MPDGDFQDFKIKYYKIINDIADKAVSQGSVKLDQEFNKLKSDFISDEFAIKLTNLKEQFTDPGVQTEIQNEGFKFEFNELLEKNENNKIFKYFHDIDNGNNIEVDIDELDIPDVNKQEIQAQGFVKAFEVMKSRGDDSVEFQKYYKNVQTMSMQSDLLEVENPEISSSLDRANGVFNNFNRAYESLVDGDIPILSLMFENAEKAYDFQHDLRIKLAQHIALNNIPVFDDSGEISKKFDDLEVGNIFEGSQITEGVDDYLKKSVSELIRDQSEITKLNKVFHALDIDGQNIDSFRKLVAEEKAKIESQRQREYENRQSSTVETDITNQSVVSPKELNRKEQKLLNLKENLAKKILKVAGVSDKQIFAIMQDPKAKSAIMKRANQVLEGLNIKDADVLRFGPDNAMINVKDEDLKYSIQDQAEELVAQTGRRSSFSVDTRDMRGKGEFHDYYQKKAQKLSQNKFEDSLLEALKFEDEKDNRNLLESSWDKFKRIPAMLTSKLPTFKPGEKAIIGVVAAVVIPPPLGVIVGLYLVGKAFDEKTGVLSWIADKILPRNEEREIVNNEELEKVNVKDLLIDKSKGLDKSVSQDKTQQKDVERGQDKQTERVTQVEQQNNSDKQLNKTGNITPQDNLQKMIDSNPELRKDFERVVDGAIKSKQNRDKIIETAKEIARKDPKGKQRPMDDLDLMSAKSRVNNEFRKHKYTGRQ